MAIRYCTYGASSSLTFTLLPNLPQVSSEIEILFCHLLNSFLKGQTRKPRREAIFFQFWHFYIPGKRASFSTKRANYVGNIRLFALLRFEVQKVTVFKQTRGGIIYGIYCKNQYCRYGNGQRQEFRSHQLYEHPHRVEVSLYNATYR